MSKGKFSRVGNSFVSGDGERAVVPVVFGFACYTKDFPSWPQLDRFSKVFNVGSSEDAEVFLCGSIPEGEKIVVEC